MIGIAQDMVGGRLFEGVSCPVSSAVNVAQLKMFTEMLVSQARRMARDGHKDDARYLLRYVENSRIPEIVAEAGLDATRLRHDLVELTAECHPAAAPARSADIEDILERLSKLEAMRAGRARGGVKNHEHKTKRTNGARD